MRGDADVEEALGSGAAPDTALRNAIVALETPARAGEFVNEVEIARIYVRLKEPERALDWLERAYESHNPNLTAINNRLPFDPLRANPRFQALLRRMKLPQ